MATKADDTNHNGSTESIVISGHHHHFIPRPSSPSSSSLSMDRTNSSDSYVNVSNPDRHPNSAPEPFSSSVARVDATPHSSFNVNSLPVQARAFTTVMDYCDGDKLIGFEFTPEQVRDILHKSTFFLSEEVSAWNRHVVVPYGTKILNFICVYAAREGLHVNALYDEFGWFVPAPRGMSAEELRKRNFLTGLRQKETIHVMRYSRRNVSLDY